MQTTPSRLTSSRTHLILDLPMGLLPSNFLTKTLHVFAPIRSICSAFFYHRISIILITVGEEYKL
jgi:hypothetical protein